MVLKNPYIGKRNREYNTQNNASPTNDDWIPAGFSSKEEWEAAQAVADSYLEEDFKYKKDGNDDQDVNVPAVPEEDVELEVSITRSIPLHDDRSGFGSVLENTDFCEDNDSYNLHQEDHFREIRVKGVANMLYRYNKIVLEIIYKNRPKERPDLWQREEMFADKIGLIAQHVWFSSRHVDIMSKDHIKDKFNIDSDMIALFVERMGFYNLSCIRFDYMSATDDHKSIMVVHRSTMTKHMFLSVYKWGVEPQYIHDVASMTEYMVIDGEDSEDK